MKKITLTMDHRQWVDGKMTHYKKGETITVTNREFDHITNAVMNLRIELRETATKTQGTPEWKSNRDR